MVIAQLGCCLPGICHRLASKGGAIFVRYRAIVGPILEVEVGELEVVMIGLEGIRQEISVAHVCGRVGDVCRGQTSKEGF